MANLSVGPRTVLEALGLLVLGAVVGLAGNALSPRGMALTLSGQPPWIDERIRMLTLEEGKALFQQGAIFVDARNEAEFLKAHIDGAFHLDVESPDKDRLIVERLDMLPRDLPIVTYCDSQECGLSKHLAEDLLDFGFTNVSVFKPGWNEWVKENLPIEEGPGRAAEIYGGA